MLHRVKRTPDHEEFNFENLGINVKLHHLDTNNNTGHIANITFDLEKFHFSRISGKVLKLNVEYHQNENQVNATVRYLFPDRNNLTGAVELELSKVDDTFHLKMKYLNRTFQVDVQSADKIFQATIINEINKYFLTANIDPGVKFSLTLEDQDGNSMIDLVINSWETYFKIEDSVYQLFFSKRYNDDQFQTLAELSIAENYEFKKIKFHIRNLNFELEYTKQTRSMKISVIKKSMVLIVFRLKPNLMDQTKDVCSYECEVSYQLGYSLFGFHNHGKIRLCIGADRAYQNYGIVRILKIILLPEYSNSKEIKLEVFLDREHIFEQNTNYKTLESLQIKGLVGGAQLFSLESDLKTINKNSWEATYETRILFDPSVTPVPRFFQIYFDFSEATFTAIIGKDSADLNINRDRSSVLSMNVLMQRNLYLFKMSAFGISTRNPIIPGFIKSMAGYESPFDIPELSIEAYSTVGHFGLSGVLSTSKNIGTLDFRMMKYLTSGKLILTGNDFVVLQAELKEFNHLENHQEFFYVYENRDIFMDRYQFKIVENENFEISLLELFENVLRNEGNLYDIEVSGKRYFIQGKYYPVYERFYNLKLKTGQDFELHLSSSYLINKTDSHDHDGKKTQNVDQNMRFYLDPRLESFKIEADLEFKDQDYIQSIIHPDYAHKNLYLLKRFIKSFLDIDGHGTNYASLGSTIKIMNNLGTRRTGSLTYVYFNDRDVFTYEVNTKSDSFEIKVNVPILLMTNTSGLIDSNHPVTIAEQDTLTVALYSNNATMLGMYIKGKISSCLDDIGSPSLELTRYQEVIFNHETMKLENWKGATCFFNCLGNEHLWNLESYIFNLFYFIGIHF